MHVDDDGVPRIEGIGVVVLRLAAFAAAGVMLSLVLATFMTAVQIAPLIGERESLDTVATAVLFFGPMAGILTLAFIVVLALTRPVSMRMPGRRRATRAVALGYIALGLVLAVWLRPLLWGWAIALLASTLGLLAWWLLHRAEGRRGSPLG